MKCVILAGGKGLRLSEFTKTIPKPMVKIKGVPILMRIIKHYMKYGFNDFIIATGYKSKIVEKYFNKKNYKKINVKIIFTGNSTMTGGRLKKLNKLIGNEKFMLTYGDGLSSVNLKKLLKFHNSNNGICTLTAVRPNARFGAIKINGKKVIYFKEKSKLDEGWINGGFFVFEPEIFKFIKGNNTFLEREPMNNISRKGKLFAFKHYGFWQCMDTLRDKEILEKSLKLIK